MSRKEGKQKNQKDKSRVRLISEKDCLKEFYRKIS